MGNAGSPPAGSLSSAGGSRPAGGLGFRQAIGDFMSKPGVRAGGYVLAGLPIAMDAIGQLSQDPNDPIGNASGALGSVGGGIGGGIGGGLLGAKIGLLGGPLGSAVGFGVGSWLGSQAGGGLARNASTAIQGFFNDPVAKEIRNTERLYRSQTALELERARDSLPMQRALLQKQYEDEARRAQLGAQLAAQARYQQGLFGAAAAPVGAYADLGFTTMLSNIGTQALR
jgi:hypothetical protein